MINWKSAEQVPKEGDEIWILMSHWKSYWPSSYNIAAGEVEFGKDGCWRVNTCDYDGCGSHCYYPSTSNYSYKDEVFNYWCEKEEITAPDCRQE